MPAPIIERGLFDKVQVIARIRDESYALLCYAEGPHRVRLLLTVGPDEALIEHGTRVFRERTDPPFDGFEVWDGARRVDPKVIEEPDQ
jgi:hypothetical protein